MSSDESTVLLVCNGMIDPSVDNLAAIHVISIKNEEGYYYGEFIPSRKIDVYAIDKFPNG
ncbi:MAG: hypothetical protein WBZ36_12865 [Candidatus Nitrosopolaris sp.]